MNKGRRFLRLRKYMYNMETRRVCIRSVRLEL